MNWPDYGQLSQWLMLFGQTVAVGMIAVIGYAVLGDILDRQRAVVKSALIGALFGCAAVALMNFPVRIADGIILDTRNVLVLIGCFSADPPGALFAIALPVLFRVDLGGAGVTMGIASIVATGLIGLSVRRYYRDRVRDFGLGQFALIGLAPALVTIAAVRGALAINGLSSIAGTFDVAVLVIYPCVTALIGSAMSMTYYRAWRRTRRRLVDILETASDLVWETDGANHLTFVSDRFRGILGFEAAELLGSNIDALGGRWLDEATRAAHVSALAAREPFDELTYLATAKDGSRKTLSISARPHLDPKGRFLGYRGTAVDITDRERWQALIATVSGQVGDRVGDEFLRTLTRSVAEALGANWAFLSRYDAERRAVRSLVRFAEGKVTANNEVLVGDLPGRGIGEGKIAGHSVGAGAAVSPLRRDHRLPGRSLCRNAAGRSERGGSGHSCGLLPQADPGRRRRAGTADVRRPCRGGDGTLHDRGGTAPQPRPAAACPAHGKNRQCRGEPGDRRGLLVRRAVSHFRPRSGEGRG